MTDPICRWGILSTANISRKNWKAIRLSGNSVVGGVSSRSSDRAAEFIGQCQAEVPFDDVPRPFAGHQALLDSDQIDAVYIPLPTGVRKDWVIAAARAKKHVLVEKPVATCTADAEEMRRVCQEEGVLLMDGVMFDHGKRIRAVCDQVRGGDIGRLRRIQTHFSFASDETFRSSNIRTDAELEPYGCVGDLGWYCVRFVLWINEFRMPQSVSGRVLTSLTQPGAEQSVPGEFVGELVFEGGVTAGFYCSFLTEHHQTALISGDQGYLSLNDFVLPFYDSKTNWTLNRHELEIDNCRWNFRPRTQRRAADEYHSGEANAQEAQMIRTFAERIFAGQVDDHFFQRSIKTQRVLEACLESAADGGRFVALGESK